MARDHPDATTSPFRKVMRTTALACMAAATGVLGVHWSGTVAGTDDLIPMAVVLGVWANLLSIGLLLTRNRD